MIPKNPTIDDVYEAAGKSLSKVLEYTFYEDKEGLVDWFYNSRNQITNETPYEICQDGREQELEDILLHIASGAGGG